MLGDCVKACLPRRSLDTACGKPCVMTHDLIRAPSASDGPSDPSFALRALIARVLRYRRTGIARPADRHEGKRRVVVVARAARSDYQKHAYSATVNTVTTTPNHLADRLGVRSMLLVVSNATGVSNGFAMVTTPITTISTAKVIAM